MSLFSGDQFGHELNRLREIVSTPHFVADILQPHKRSYSQPDLSQQLLDRFDLLRQLLVSDDLKHENNNNNNNQDDRPVPKPRRNRGKHKSTRYECESISTESENMDMISTECSHQDTCLASPKLPTSINQYVELPTIANKSQAKKKIKSKGQSFKQSFLRINKLATDKFLSIRISKELIRKKLTQQQQPNVYKSRRPTRSPPATPILIFRRAAPTPSDTDSEFDGVSELYQDSMQPYESIYCTVDGDEDGHRDVNKPQPTISSPDITKEDGISTDSTLHDSISHQYDETPQEEEEDYYQIDEECIYEELSSNDGTIYEEYFENEEDCIYDNVEIIDSKDLTEDDRKQIKRLRKIHKQMKQFKLNGDEIPVNAGIVKQDRRGNSRTGDLLVRANETVLILRMEANPPGKWLAKNERSKIGYVDLDNLHFDAESIKAVIKSFRNTNAQSDT